MRVFPKLALTSAQANPLHERALLQKMAAGFPIYMFSVVALTFLTGTQAILKTWMVIIWKGAILSILLPIQANWWARK